MASLHCVICEDQRELCQFISEDLVTTPKNNGIWTQLCSWGHRCFLQPGPLLVIKLPTQPQLQVVRLSDVVDGPGPYPGVDNATGSYWAQCGDSWMTHSLVHGTAVPCLTYRCMHIARAVGGGSSTEEPDLVDDEQQPG